MAVVGRGKIIVWEGASLWMFAAERGSAETEPHAHHAIQITFALEGSFEIGCKGQWMSNPVVAVAADTKHIFRATGAAAHLFVEPDSAVGRALSSLLFHDGQVVPVITKQATSSLASLRASFHAGLGSDDLLKVGQVTVHSLSAAVTPAIVDDRVVQMAAFADTHLDGGVSLAAAASHVCLSPSRASHLFVANTGLAFKTYLLWLRLRRAVALYAGGCSLTEAAHEAGFADSAHFSRTFRRTFGLSAISLRLVSS